MSIINSTMSPTSTYNYNSATSPQEVARTRLREDGSKYNSFWQTLHIVYREEGHSGLYRGLFTQLIRQIPNTAIMMATYEFSVNLLTRWLKNDGDNIESL